MNSKKTAADFMEQRAAVFVRRATEITPPGSEAVRGVAAKKRGQTMVEADLGRLFIPWTQHQVKGKMGSLLSGSSMPGYHRSRRRKADGHVRKNAKKANVAKADFLDYQKRTKKRVGSLAGGFNRAAGRFGVRPAAWIWNQNTAGAVEVTATARGIIVRITNAKSFAAETRGLENRLQRALNEHAQAMRRQADDFYKKVGRKSGWRVR